MKKATFKTNINCGGCIATVTPFLDKVSTLKSWSVDTNSKSKLLTVEGNEIEKDEVIKAVQSAGFEIKEKKRLLSF
ncbi:heavy-metal-associated domain-containing protein [Roseivirga sp.]|uniref:heavy-metal-associated domain-containing protein n=1 Tax=Roseivirga sp. TaxID=1964215 RepID=UPI003B8CE8C4